MLPADIAFMMMADQETEAFRLEKGEMKMKEIKNENANSKIQELFNEVKLYKQAIRDAEDALASAEMELDETLDEVHWLIFGS